MLPSQITDALNDAGSREELRFVTATLGHLLSTGRVIRQGRGRYLALSLPRLNLSSNRRPVHSGEIAPSARPDRRYRRDPTICSVEIRSILASPAGGYMSRVIVDELYEFIATLAANAIDGPKCVGTSVTTL